MRKICKITIITVSVLIIITFLTSQMINDGGLVYAQGGNTSDIQLLARAINGEARGEPYEGQVAVGAVIINRTKNAGFPKTISGVIYQPGAFTAVTDGQINVCLLYTSPSPRD